MTTSDRFLELDELPRGGRCGCDRWRPTDPVAEYEGEIVAANLLEGNHRKADYQGVGSVMFTTPLWLLWEC